MIHLEWQNLTVNYEGRNALADLSWQVQAGCITGLVGPNGAGKSTLFKTSVGLIDTYGGCILYNGQPMEDVRFKVKQKAVYAGEHARLLPYLTGAEFLRVLAGIYALPQPAERIGFVSRLTGLEKELNRIVNDYSHGMRQKLALCAALLPEADYIFLDEALNGVDSLALDRIKNHLQELATAGKLIILASHNIDLVRSWCDPIALLHNGRLLAQFDQQQIARQEKEQQRSFSEIYLEMTSRDE